MTYSQKRMQKCQEAKRINFPLLRFMSGCNNGPYHSDVIKIC